MAERIDVFISSTSRDLESYRDAVTKVVLRLGLHPIIMEAFNPTDRNALQLCFDKVQEAEIFVGIYAHRYGYAPSTEVTYILSDGTENTGDGVTSITHLEYLWALKRNIPILLFVIDDKDTQGNPLAWPLTYVETEPGKTHLENFKKKILEDHVVGFFYSPDQLATQVATGLSELMRGDIQFSRKSKVDINRMPIPQNPIFRGRSNELDLLNKAWTDQTARIVALVAFGGAGKSTLIFNWLRILQTNNYYDADRVFAWSFYSQGTSERVTAAGEFISEALKFFGDPNPQEGTVASQGERLARLIGTQRSLLILDGLEPLQYPPGDDREGEIKDRALQSLLRNIAFSQGKCLCVITTRATLTDLTGLGSDVLKTINLDRLSAEDGSMLLKDLGIEGTDDQLKQTVDEYDGHPLALTLLSSYLHHKYHNDVRRRDMIGPLTYAPKQGGHARRVMQSYANWFSDGDDEKPELQLLRLLGLFDRPADGEIIYQLRRARIPNLTDNLSVMELSDFEWEGILSTLREYHLIAPRDPFSPDYLDTHPLVREHFGEKTETELPGAWSKGNTVIHDYLTKHSEKHPTTLETMSPLYSAIYHGTRGGLYKQTLENIYKERILREDFFSTRSLGALGEDLAALSNYFEKPYSKLVEDLSEDQKAFVLRQTGYCLRGLGRLIDAADCMKIALFTHIDNENHLEAARIAGLISQTYMSAGELSLMKRFAYESIEYADQAGNDLERTFKRTTLAYMLNLTGESDKALQAYNEGINLLDATNVNEYAILRGFSYFHHCYILEESEQYDEMEAEARAAIELLSDVGEQGNLALGFAYLSLGRSFLVRARNQPERFLADALTNIEKAMELLDKSARDDSIALGLLARAEAYGQNGQTELMKLDLDRSLLIAKRGELNLYLADTYLGLTNYHLLLDEKEAAAVTYAEATKLVQKMGYALRYSEVEYFKKKLG